MKEIINDSNIDKEENDLFNDIRYICKITPIISQSLQNGCDVAQLPNGDIIISEMKVVNTQYSWDKTKSRMIKSNQV